MITIVLSYVIIRIQSPSSMFAQHKNLVTGGFELVNHRFELVTRGFDLVTREFELAHFTSCVYGVSSSGSSKLIFFYLLKSQSDLNAKNIFDCGFVEQFSRQITYVVNSSEIFM